MTMLPLAGRRILVTRATERAGGMAARLRELGAEPVLVPTITHVPPDDQAAFSEALARLEAGIYEWLLLTSATAVEAVAQGLEGRAPRLGGRVSLRVGAVGPATAEACRALLGVEAAAVPERFIGAELVRALGDPMGRRVLLPNADRARPELEQRLREAGALVDRVVAYKTVAAGGAALADELARGLDAILFTSGSTARFLVEQLGPTGPAAIAGIAILCIGPSTAETCNQLGLAPAATAETATEEGLVAALVDYFARRRA